MGDRGDSVGRVVGRHVARVRVSLVLSTVSTLPCYDPLVPVSGSLSLGSASQCVSHCLKPLPALYLFLLPG